MPLPSDHQHFTVGPCPHCGTFVEVCGKPCFIFCPIDNQILKIDWSDEP